MLGFGGFCREGFKGFKHDPLNPCQKTQCLCGVQGVQGVHPLKGEDVALQLHVHPQD
jgi:hypothetical protein